MSLLRKERSGNAARQKRSPDDCGSGLDTDRYRCYIYLLLMTEYTDFLETYSLEEILELNDLTAEDCLEFLVEEGFVELPEVKPL